ncbi:hypothetical protein PIB30_062679 [Stylosanthes scabra]|uniref:Uncharacterized protein n=1 Tax=Stylosanthes scabra TaxID=79078 RepID=A0ABU6UK88_9FABA|nr:hypothetical protein [Stylosanthes scabra]
MADNNQHFKTRATSAAKGVYEVTPSESTILAKSLVDIAAMLKPIPLNKHRSDIAVSSRVTHTIQMNALNCKKTTLLWHLTISMRTNNCHPTTDNIIHSSKGGAITNKTDGTHLNNHNKHNSSNHTHIANHKTHKTQDINHLILDKPIHHRMLPHSTMNKPFELISKIFTNQPTINPQSQLSTSSPLPSQPLPNPKGGINMVHNEVVQEEEEEYEEEEGEDDWLYELLAELASSDESEDEEEVEEEIEEEVVEKQDEEETFFIAYFWWRQEGGA